MKVSANIIKQSKKRMKIGTIIFIVCLMFPALSNIAIFWLGTNIQSITMAFRDFTTKKFTLENFPRAWQLFSDTKGSDLGRGFINTIKFFCVGLLTLPITIFTAYMIFKKMAMHSFVRVVLYLPGAVSGVMMAKLFQQFVMADGILGNIINLDGGSLLTQEATALGTIIFFDIWLGLGGGLIIWLGTMNRIPPDLIEYNRILGIGEIREFVFVVMPLIWPTFVTLVTMQIIGFFGASGSVLLFTQGGYNTMTIGYWMYHIVMHSDVSYFNVANAAGIAMTLITLPVLIAGRTIMKKYGQEVEY